MEEYLTTANVCLIVTSSIAESISQMLVKNLVELERTNVTTAGTSKDAKRVFVSFCWGRMISTLTPLTLTTWTMIP